MARLQCIADGNFLDSTTWGLIDSTSAQVAGASSTALTTSYVLSQTFTPGAITIDGIVIRIASRAAAPGANTISVALDQGGVTVAGTEVTLNVSDLSVHGNGYYFFKFAAPVTLLAATLYSVKAKASAASQCNLFRDATAGNWNRLLRTTTQQAPAAADDLFIIGARSSAGSVTSRTVTMNSTSRATTYGSIVISDSGTLVNGTTALTTYGLKHKQITVYAGGLFEVGYRSGTRIPSDSKAEYEFACTTNGEFGLRVENGGVFHAAGADIAETWALLDADASAGATSLTTDRSTGWKQDDEIGIAPTRRTFNEFEKRSLTVDASGTTLTVAATTFIHSGSNNASGDSVRAELINLTRRVRFFGQSAAQAWSYTAGRGISDCDSVEFKYFGGSGTGTTQGIYLDNDTARTETNFYNKVALHEFQNTAPGFFINAGNNSGSWIFTNCVTYNITEGHLGIRGINLAGACTFQYENCVHIGFGTNSQSMIDLNFGQSTVAYPLIKIDGIRVAGCSAAENAVDMIFSGAGFNETGRFKEAGYIRNILVHTCAQYGIRLLNFYGHGSDKTLIENLTAWRCGREGIIFDNMRGVKVSGIKAFGNVATANANLTLQTTMLDVQLVEPKCYGETAAGFASTCGLMPDARTEKLRVIKPNFFGHGEADIKTTNSSRDVDTVYIEPTFGSATEIDETGWFDGMFGSSGGTLYARRLGFMRVDGNADRCFAFLSEGKVSKETVIAGSKVRLTPKSANVYLKTTVAKKRFDFSAHADYEVTVQVRKSVLGDGTAYNGAEVELWVRAQSPTYNVDTVLATSTSAANGAYEDLVGSIVVTEDIVLEFFVRCNGSAGWVNIGSIGIAEV